MFGAKASWMACAINPVTGAICSLSLRLTDHFIGVAARFFGNRNAAEHACNLIDALRIRESVDPRLGGFPVGGFDNPKLLVCLRGNLRQMSDAQDLPLFAESSQQLANNLGGSAADADIDLVKDQRWDLRTIGRRNLNRQADPRQFSARSDVR